MRQKKKKRLIFFRDLVQNRLKILKNATILILFIEIKENSFFDFIFHL